MTTFAIIDESKGITGGNLRDMALPLEVNLGHCAKAWGLPRPTVQMWTSRAPLPADYLPIILVDESSPDDNFLAVHYVLAGRPTGKVFVGKASGLNIGGNSVMESLSHEALEMLINPMLRRWADMPGRPGVEVALEVCDPVQDHYEIDGWKVANFIHPAWFGRANYPGFRPEQMDHLGTLSHAGQIGPVGYAILRDPVGGISYAGRGPLSQQHGSVRPRVMRVGDAAAARGAA